MSNPAEQIEKEPIKLVFEYSPESEENRVRETLDPKEVSWFKENNYFVKLPGNLYLDEATTRDLSEVLAMIPEEFDETTFDQEREKIELVWRKKSGILEKGLASLNLVPDDKYKIILTRYGVVGSYEVKASPKEIILNIQSGKRHLSEETICHEIIHLCIEEWVLKYKISHQAKEHIVDLIMKEIFSEEQLQNIDPNLARKIDQIFETNKTNIEEVVKQVGIMEDKS
ncbi:MAG: hypothetical protein NTY66_01040 [Candidatus Vogelbacteria bacterium]|nr:hypothetical protein [Candidatus Vogelbacteria bacterium]